MANKHKTKQKKATTQASTNNYLVPIIAIVVALVAVGAVLLGNTAAPVADDQVVLPGDAAAEAVGVQLISPAAYSQQLAETEHFLLDVRTPGEFAAGHIDGATNIADYELAQRISELPRDVPIVLYCRSGNRSSSAARILESNGFTTVYDIAGGTNNWTSSGYALTR